MVVGFVSLVLAGALRTALSPSGPWCAKLASNVFWRAVRLGQQKGRLIRAAHRGWFRPVVGHLNATKSCAISLIIAQRMLSGFEPVWVVDRCAPSGGVSR